MKKLSKAVSLLIAVVLVCSVFAACQSSPAGSGTSSAAAPSAAGSTASSDAAPSEGDETYTMFIRSTYADWIKELKWYDEAEKRTGINVEYVYGPEEFYDCYAEVDQRIISGTLPDATMTKMSQTNVYGPQGVFMDLAPYIDKYAPNIKAYIESDPVYKALVTSEDGAIYALSKETPIFADFIGYRADHFRKAGVDAASVKTVEDFTNAMRALKAHYGADNPNYYPLCGRDAVVRFAAWFGAASNISSTESNGIYVNGRYKDGSIDIMSENAYTMTETMKLWYDEGLINPEWVAGTAGEADWEATMLNGNGSIFYDYYNRAEWFMNNGGPEADPDYDMAVLDFLKDSSGNTMKVTTSMKFNDETVTAVNAKCSEETVKTILTFIDYFYSEEGIILANYGVEGESFKYGANGEPEFIVDYKTEESTPGGEKRWSFLSDRLTVCKPVDNEAFFKWNSPLISEAAGRLLKSENLMTSYTLKLDETQSKELSNLVAAVFDSQMAGVVSFVNGTRALNQEEWAKYQAEMNALGLSKIEEIQLAAYQNTYGK